MAAPESIASGYEFLERPRNAINSVAADMMSALEWPETGLVMHAEFHDVVVCIPTVAGRSEVLALTLEEWRRFGVEPLVHVQPEDWPLSPTFSRKNTDAALRRTLAEHPSAAYVLLCEDDVVIAQEIVTWMPALKLLGAPSTLYLNGLDHYPVQIAVRLSKALSLPERLIRVRNLGSWYGSLAVLMPRELANRALAWQSDRTGWDIHFQGLLLQHRITLYAPVPNPVQHRDVPSTHRVGGGWMRSETFGRRGDGGGTSPGAGVDWPALGGWWFGERSEFTRVIPGEPSDSRRTPSRRSNVTHLDT